MKKEIWGFNVIGPQGLDARNDFAVGPNDEGDDVVLRVNQAELTGKEFETLKEIAEGGPVPGGSGAIIEQDLDAIGFIPVANTYYQQKSGPKPEPTLQAFTLGQTLNTGDKMHFDTTKEDAFRAYIESLECPNGFAILMSDLENPIFDMKNPPYVGILVEDMAIMSGGQAEGRLVVAGTMDDENSSVFCTQDINTGDEIISAGWHNLDANGDKILTMQRGQRVINCIVDTTPATWNGVIAGQMDEIPQSQFVDGLIYFYDGEEYHAITGDGGEGTLDYNKLENIPIINLTENKTTVLSPFEIGQVLNSESILHIDTNKEEEFLSYLQTLEYPEQIPIAAFMRAKRAADSNLILLLATHQDDVYMLAIGRVGEDNKMLYVSQDFYDEQTSTQYYKGFQNLDANGNLQFTQLLTPADGDFIIEQIVDTNPPTWNGAIISAVKEETIVSPTPVDGEFYKRNGQIYKYTAAKMSESQPELYDKVVLESELGGDEKHLYRHDIEMVSSAPNTYRVYFTVISNNGTAVENAQDIIDILDNSDIYYSATGYWEFEGQLRPIVAICAEAHTVVYDDDVHESALDFEDATLTLRDHITQLI